VVKHIRAPWASVFEVEPARVLHSRRSKQKRPHKAAISVLLVEAAGIEPASASTTLQDTTCLAHSLCLVERYPKGREDVQPTAERFNGPTW